MEISVLFPFVTKTGVTVTGPEPIHTVHAREKGGEDVGRKGTMEWMGLKIR